MSGLPETNFKKVFDVLDDGAAVISAQLLRMEEQVGVAPGAYANLLVLDYRDAL